MAVADLDGAVAEYTDAIEENAPLSMQASKLTVTEILKDSSGRDLAAIDEIGRICFDSNDFKEGRTAFMEKRRPVFTGT